MASGTSPVFAEYGDGANVFGRITNKSGFVPYTGEGFALMLPSKWNPSKEKDFPDVKLRSANQKADTPVLDVANAALCAVCHHNVFVIISAFVLAELIHRLGQMPSARIRKAQSATPTP